MGVEPTATPPRGTPAAPRRRAREVGFDLAALLGLATISFLVGCLINAVRTKPLPWVYQSRAQTMDEAVQRLGQAAATPPPDVQGEPPHEIRLDEFQSFVAERKGLVLDARPRVFYREGHVPGALNLPREAFAEEYPRLRVALEPSKDRPIAIYCSGADCPDSQLLGDALTKLGYHRLLIYTSGWEEWTQAGLPQEGASAPP